MIPLIEIKKLQNHTASVENVIDIALKLLIFTCPEASDWHLLDRIYKNVCEYSLNKGHLMIIWSIDNKKECLKECKSWTV